MTNEFYIQTRSLQKKKIEQTVQNVMCLQHKNAIYHSCLLEAEGAAIVDFAIHKFDLLDFPSPNWNQRNSLHLQKKTSIWSK